MERCRCCLQPLAELDTNLLQTPHLAEMYTCCTSLDLLANDKYPKCICNDCTDQLEAFNQFRSLCKESLERLSEIIYSKQALTMVIDDEQANYDLAKNVDQDIIVRTFEDKNLTLLIHSQVKQQCKEVNDEKLNNNIDKYSGKGKSLILDAPGEKLSPAISTKTDIEENSKNDIINRNKRDIKSHSRPQKAQEKHIIGDNSSSCNKCDIPQREQENLGLYPSDALTDHLQKHDSKKPNFTCSELGCNRVYKHKPTLIMHMRKYHKHGPEPKSHICEICGKVFKSSTILNDHHYTHKDKSELPYACEKSDCRHRFSNKEKLKVHMLRHAGIKNYVCPYCGMRKTTRNELNVHINYHTLERTWACRFCTKVCNSAGNLKMHIRTVHEQAKDYACRFCERSFAKSDTRKYHEMTHTGEKPHQCKECGKRFTQPAALRTHRKIHLRHTVHHSGTILSADTPSTTLNVKGESEANVNVDTVPLNENGETAGRKEKNSEIIRM